MEVQQHIVFLGKEANTNEQGRYTELTASFKLNAEEKEELGNNFSPINIPAIIHAAWRRGDRKQPSCGFPCTGPLNGPLHVDRRREGPYLE